MASVGPYSVLLFDMDGTILTTEQIIHAKNVAYLRALQEAGVRVGFASGRSPASMSTFFTQFHPNSLCVACNGAVVFDPKDRRILSMSTLARDDALRALEIGEATPNLHINLYLGDLIYIEKVNELSAASEKKDGVPHTIAGMKLSEFLRAQDGAAPIKLLFIVDPNDVPRIRALRTQLEQPGVFSSHVTLVHSEPYYLEVLPEGVHKGAGVLRLCELAGVPAAAVMAFGDQLNDMELVRSVGHGVAMGNGHADLRAIAKAVIGDHNTDAIAQYLGAHYEVKDGALHVLVKTADGRVVDVVVA